MYLLGAAAALFGLDQCLKQLVEGQSPERFPRSMDHTGGRIKLYRNHNRGFCFEVLKHRPSLVRQLPLCLTSMAGGILCFLSAQKGYRAEKAGYALLTWAYPAFSARSVFWRQRARPPIFSF